MRFHWLWPVIILLSAIATSIVTYVAPETPVKALVVMSFLFLCPGMALTRFLRLHETVAELIIALTLSFSIDAIVAGLFLYSRHWSISGIIMTLLVFSVTGAIGQLVILHPAMAQRLYALPLQHKPKQITGGMALTLPEVVPSRTLIKVENSADEETVPVPNDTSTSGIIQAEDSEVQETAHLTEDKPLAEITQAEDSEEDA